MTSFSDILKFNKILNSWRYGLVINGVYDKNRNTTAKDWDKYYKLASPEELIKRKVGVCWDYTILEANIFSKYFSDIPFKTWYIMFDDKADMPTHTFLTFQYNNKFYWFESAFKKVCGVWEANSEKEIIDAVITAMDNHHPVLQYPYYVYTFNSLNKIIYGFGCVQFMDYISSTGKRIPYKYTLNNKIKIVKENKSMDMMELILSIHESVYDGIISEQEGYKAIEMIQEGVITSPLRKKIEKLKEIKNAKPKEYDGPEDVKKFVDKYYDEIVKCAEFAEKEPAQLRSNEVKAVVGYIVGIVGGMAAMLGGEAIASVALITGGIVVFILATILPTIHVIISYIRKSDDIKATDELAKIRSALKKVNVSKLPKEYKNKVSDLITSIDDAETEISSRLKVSKESVDTTDMKLKIYESCMDKKITESERDTLLNSLNK